MTDAAPPEFDEEDWLTVHLNGFASGRDYERPRTRKQAEREIVAWLRDLPLNQVVCQHIANAIERGEYRPPA